MKSSRKELHVRPQEGLMLFSEKKFLTCLRIKCDRGVDKNLEDADSEERPRDVGTGLLSPSMAVTSRRLSSTDGH